LQNVVLPAELMRVDCIRIYWTRRVFCTVAYFVQEVTSSIQTVAC